MDQDRLNIETEAEIKKVNYNFIKRINHELENGTPIEILQIISSYNIYMGITLNIMNYKYNDGK